MVGLLPRRKRKKKKILLVFGQKNFTVVISEVRKVPLRAQECILAFESILLSPPHDNLRRFSSELLDFCELYLNFLGSGKGSVGIKHKF